jgi:hypothetical protein
MMAFRQAFVHDPSFPRTRMVWSPPGFTNLPLQRHDQHKSSSRCAIGRVFAVQRSFYTTEASLSGLSAGGLPATELNSRPRESPRPPRPAFASWATRSRQEIPLPHGRLTRQRLDPRRCCRPDEDELPGAEGNELLQHCRRDGEMSDWIVLGLVIRLHRVDVGRERGVRVQRVRQSPAVVLGVWRGDLITPSPAGSGR